VEITPVRRRSKQKINAETLKSEMQRATGKNEIGRTESRNGR
jgi:hypothetical protein